MSDRLAPGATLGILGGGQLGRMLALAAARLGYRTHVYCPEADNPASQVSTVSTFADYGDEAALARFAAAVDAVTYEFENVPAATAAFLEVRTRVRPGGRVLEVAQDRVKEKKFFSLIGLETADWRPVNALSELERAVDELAAPCVLKTARLGYDGKGQAKIKAGADTAPAWAAIGGARARPHADGGAYAIVERMVDFAREISVIVARGADGTVHAFEPAENVHTNHILDTSTVPARVSHRTVSAAMDAAMRAARAFDLVGLLALEFFVRTDGAVLGNEMAPRPHNSGHWTMDACQTDQFEQLVRAVMGLPLREPMRFADVTMKNLIGDDVLRLDAALADPSAHLHLYGKREARPGRKMGHVNRLRFPKTG
ncbi:MAG: 5-(carboxyamino)imidazole ribonucleotide synthase [Rhodospirillaceae bacterium]|nr:5-(carboxyamino)imidazole ribonucleotide synthase [Rhodospirillaceae bacterium]